MLPLWVLSPPFWLQSTTLVQSWGNFMTRIQIPEFLFLFCSSNFSFKGTNFINDFFDVECCASNFYFLNLCKTGTSIRKPLLMPCVWASLQIPSNLLLQPEGGEIKIMCMEILPQHTNASLSTAIVAEVKATDLPTNSWVFYKFSISYSPIFGLRLIWVCAFGQNTRKQKEQWAGSLESEFHLKFCHK